MDIVQALIIILHPSIYLPKYVSIHITVGMASRARMMVIGSILIYILFLLALSDDDDADDE